MYALKRDHSHDYLLMQTASYNYRISEFLIGLCARNFVDLLFRIVIKIQDLKFVEDLNLLTRGTQQRHLQKIELINTKINGLTLF